MRELLNLKLRTAMRSSLAVKKNHFWIDINKQLILKRKKESIDKKDQRRVGVKHNVFPWERAVSGSHIGAMSWWFNAGVCYDWLLDNGNCPLNQRGRSCYQSLGLPRSVTPQSIFNFIDRNGDPNEHKEYVKWKSTESTRALLKIS